jgi:Tol biopolymer transport system component
MTMPERFERTVTVWLRDEAERPFPDLLDALLERTTTTRQRQWWSSPERWLPMDTTYRANALLRPGFSRALLIAALVLALVGAVLVVGSRQTRVPAPFGPADNGHILYSANGDIFIADADASHPRVLVSDPADDYAPVLSHDGTRFVFFRFTGSSDEFDVLAANVDGSDVRTLTPAPMNQPFFADWSPDGSDLLIAHGRDGVSGISILATDGSRRLRDLPTNGLSIDAPVWLPPEGREIMFRGSLVSITGLYAIGADGSGLRNIAPDRPDNSRPYYGPHISPDGTRVTFWNDQAVDASEQHPEDHKSEVHVLDLSTGKDLRIGYDPASRHELEPRFSPDGRSILMVRFTVDPDAASLVLASADGSDGAGRQIGPPMDWQSSGSLESPSIEFSPDGHKVLLSFGADRRIQIVDVATGAVQDGDYGDFVIWQRVAR